VSHKLIKYVRIRIEFSEYNSVLLRLNEVVVFESNTE